MGYEVANTAFETNIVDNIFFEKYPCWGVAVTCNLLHVIIFITTNFKMLKYLIICIFLPRKIFLNELYEKLRGGRRSNLNPFCSLGPSHRARLTNTLTFRSQILTQGAHSWRTIGGQLADNWWAICDRNVIVFVFVCVSTVLWEGP